MVPPNNDGPPLPATAAPEAPAVDAPPQVKTAAQAALLAEVESHLDDIAADLTGLYRANIPVYDKVDESSIRRNTRAVLELAARSLGEPAPGTSLNEIGDLARVWAQQQIPLELVAHSIQVGARRLVELIREQARVSDVPVEQINNLQDLAWQWATAHAAAVHMVQQERAVAEATRRGDFLRRLVEGGLAPAALSAEAPHYRLDLTHAYHVACMRWDDTVTSSDLAAGLRTRGATAQLSALDAVIDGVFVALLPQRPRLSCPDRAVGLGPAVRPTELARSYRHALQAMTIAEQYRRTGVVDLSDLGPMPLIARQDDETADMLDAKHLGPLRAQGSAGQEILTTIATYLANDRKVEETARGLFVHRNTIRYRLTRFTELTGLDIDKTDDLVLAWWLLNRGYANRKPLKSAENRAQR
ncbi:PucR family transcriptional regulator [Mycobacterium colombiense]